MAASPETPKKTSVDGRPRARYTSPNMLEIRRRRETMTKEMTNLRKEMRQDHQCHDLAMASSMMSRAIPVCVLQCETLWQFCLMHGHCSLCQQYVMPHTLCTGSPQAQEIDEKSECIGMARSEENR